MSTVGLYSYPRSGSNWIRLLIYSLLVDNRPFSHEDVERDIPGHPDGDPLSGPFFSTAQGPFQIFKTHALNIVDKHGVQPMDTRFYFYIYRHPLDVFCSYINYLSVYRQELQWAFEMPLLSFDEHAASGSLDDFFSMFLVSGSVSSNIEGAGSWWKSMEYWRLLKGRYIDYIHLLRYEDVVADPVGCLTAMAAFFNKTPDMLAGAVSNVAKLYGRDGAFFWQMKSGYHRELLPQHLVQKFHVRYGERLRDFGYGP